VGIRGIIAMFMFERVFGVGTAIGLSGGETRRIPIREVFPIGTRSTTTKFMVNLLTLPLNLDEI